MFVSIAEYMSRPTHPGAVVYHEDVATQTGGMCCVCRGIFIPGHRFKVVEIWFGGDLMARDIYHRGECEDTYNVIEDIEAAFG